MLLRWREWRRSRPFWGGLMAILAGAEICVIPLAPLKVMLQQGIAGIPSILMGLLMVVLGLSAWFAPHYRSLAGFVTVMIAVAALVMSNLGGFLIGTLLGVIGGSAIFAWKPVYGQGPADDPTAPTVDTEGVAGPGTDAWREAEPGPNAQRAAGTGPNTERAAEPGPDTKREAGPGPRPNAPPSPRTGTNSRPSTGSRPGIGSGTGTKSGTGSSTGPGSSTGSRSGTSSSSGTGLKSRPDPVSATAPDPVSTSTPTPLPAAPSTSASAVGASNVRTATTPLPHTAPTAPTAPARTTHTEGKRS